MRTTPNRHSELIRHPKPIKHDFRRGVDNRRRALAICKHIARPLINDQRSRRQRRRDRMCIKRQAFRLINKRAKLGIRPPSRACFGVLEILALAGESRVPVWTETLHARGHGHCDGDARVEEAGCQGGFTQARAAGYADFCAVDFGGGKD